MSEREGTEQARELAQQIHEATGVTADRETIARLIQDAVGKALESCTCPWTDPSTWTTYYGAIEPGSTQEYDPTCPMHGALRAEVIRLRAEVDTWRGSALDAEGQRQDLALGAEAEVEWLRAVVARVEALADRYAEFRGFNITARDVEKQLRAALAGPEQEAGDE